MALAVCIITCRASSQTDSIPDSDASRTELIQSLTPRLTAFAHRVEDGDTNALGAFWQEVKNTTCPIVEPVPGDSGHCNVTFLWRGNVKTLKVILVAGDFPGGDLNPSLARLSGSDIWYLTQTHPADARFDYAFAVSDPESPKDPPPLNPKEFKDVSYVELPEAPPQPWSVERPNVPKDKLTKTFFKSQDLKSEYPVSIYTPPGYTQSGDRCWLLVAFDGGFPGMEVSLNNLLADGKIPPVIVVGIHNLSGNTRMRDLAGSSEFASFIVSEVVPSVRRSYNVYDDASHTVIGGESLGGLMAIYCGLHHSGVFGKILALSPSLQIAPGQDKPNPVWAPEDPGLMSRQFVVAPLLPVEFYISMGRYETFKLTSLVYEARRLRDVLEAKGYPVGYSEYDGNHSMVNWRGKFADGLIFLTSAQPQPAASGATDGLKK